MVMSSMNDEIREKLWSRYGTTPGEDQVLLTALRKAGRELEANKRYANNFRKDTVQSGKKDKGGKKKDADTGKGKPESSEGHNGKEKGKGKKPGREDQVWKSLKEAFEGVPQGEIDAHRSAKAECWRCGGDTHRTYDCYAKRTKEGTDLPTAPSKPKPTVASAKRKRDDSESTNAPVKEESTPPEAKKPKISAVITEDTAMYDSRHWSELEPSDDEDSSDNQ
jgi:hypothetical protein